MVCIWVGSPVANTDSGTRQTRLEPQLWLGPSVTLSIFLIWSPFSQLWTPTHQVILRVSHADMCTGVGPRTGQVPLRKCWCLSSDSRPAWATTPSRHQLCPRHLTRSQWRRLSPLPCYVLVSQTAPFHPKEERWVMRSWFLQLVRVPTNMTSLLRQEVWLQHGASVLVTLKSPFKHHRL